MIEVTLKGTDLCKIYLSSGFLVLKFMTFYPSYDYSQLCYRRSPINFVNGRACILILRSDWNQPCEVV